jgi:hypothetical protein
MPINRIGSQIQINKSSSSISISNYLYIIKIGAQISPMDPQTKKFYMEIGYSEQQIIKAYEYSIRKKIDILDALSQQS